MVKILFAPQVRIAGTAGSVPKSRSARVSLCAVGLALGLAVSATATTARANGDPPFSSTADTVFDIIRADDPSSFVCLNYEGRTIRQMWDKRQDGESDLNVFLFTAHYSDGQPIDIILNPEFQSENVAREEARRYAYGLGQLPPLFRSGLKQFGIHMGREGFHGGPGKIFMYQGQADHRVSENKLEESLLHEAVHASLDARFARSPEWRAAQDADGAFLTRYGQAHPEGEDLAETVLFAYGLLAHPGRIPPVDSAVIAERVPARIAVIDRILRDGAKVEPFGPPPDTCR